jgi:glycosyltransferase involved in cell wall biosynthesis
MALLQDKKILVLHPFLNFHGGAEYLLSVVVNSIVPHADIFTFAYQNEVLRKFAIDKKRVITPAGNMLSRFYRQGTPLYPAIMDTLEVSKYDVILSFSYAYVHGVVSSHEQLHVSYIQTPMRLLWLHESDYYSYNKIPLVREVYQSILSWQRLWDKQAATRPDHLLANSKEVAERSLSVWGKLPEVIYPPVDTEYYAKGLSEAVKDDYYITHSRLVRYKRIDLLIEAAKSLHQKLVVVGDGPDYSRLRRVAGNSKDIVFTGYINDEQKRSMLHKAKGFWFAAYEDFGIAPVEAMASGLPVFAYGKGGVTETVSQEQGVFFKEQSVESISLAYNNFEQRLGQIKSSGLTDRAVMFSKESFIKNYTDKILSLQT